MEDNSLFASIVTETLQERVSNTKEIIAEKKSAIESWAATEQTA